MLPDEWEAFCEAVPDINKQLTNPPPPAAAAAAPPARAAPAARAGPSKAAAAAAAGGADGAEVQLGGKKRAAISTFSGTAQVDLRCGSTSNCDRQQRDVLVHGASVVCKVASAEVPARTANYQSTTLRVVPDGQLQGSLHELGKHASCRAPFPLQQASPRPSHALFPTLPASAPTSLPSLSLSLHLVLLLAGSAMRRMVRCCQAKKVSPSSPTSGGP